MPEPSAVLLRSSIGALRYPVVKELMGLRRTMQRAGGRLRFALPTLYPTLLRLEGRGLIKGRWVEKAGERERCYYRLTPEGRRVLAAQRATWLAYVDAVNAVMSAGDA